MKYLSGNGEKQALGFLGGAAIVARGSSCARSRCGSVVVSGGEVIGRGFNSPPNDDESERRCNIKKDTYHQKVTDKTCCVHAEQRAIMDALSRNAGDLAGARLYFVRLDENGEMKQSGEPYCTICSKMALDSGITEFVLWHEKGVCAYDTREYNELSFAYDEER